MKKRYTNPMKLYVFSFILFFYVAGNFSLRAQNKVIPVWPSQVPGAKAANNYKEIIHKDKEGNPNSLSRVTTPTLTVFRPDAKRNSGTAVVICPGGGYTHLAVNKEGYKTGHWLSKLGITAFVLTYRLPSDAIMENKTVGPLQDAQEALRIVRRNAATWHINPDKIGILGFSAGGHLAATLSTHYHQKVYDSDKTSARPDFSILLYPVISMENGITHEGSRKALLGTTPSAAEVEKYSAEKQVTRQTPPAFLVHSADDGAVPAANSISYFQALREEGVTAELHLYEDGGHGYGLGTEGTHTTWPEACKAWLKAHGYFTDKTAKNP